MEKITKTVEQIADALATQRLFALGFCKIEKESQAYKEAYKYWLKWLTN